MGFVAKWRKPRTGEANVEVSEKDGVRYLHLGSDTVQSAMRVKDPNALELAYTRAMMAFLLFHPGPSRVLMIGLGGGSLAKFLYHRLPGANVTAVEINSQVVAAAHSHFSLPPGDARFHIVVDDGSRYICTCGGGYDVVLVDGYDSSAQAGALGSAEFYGDVMRALAPGGVMVVNLWGSDARFHEYLKRIEAACEGRVLCLPAEQRSNVAVLAFRKSPGNTRWDELRERARELEHCYGLEFQRFVAALRKMNPHTDKRLLI